MDKKVPISSFTQLDAWKEGHKLVLMVYDITKKFPDEEKFGLVNQLRRASISITSNIAEGFSRNSFKEKAQFYNTSMGSVTEVQNQILIARHVGYISPLEFQEIANQSIKVSKILGGLLRASRFRIPDSRFKIPNSNNGYIALITVLVTGAVGVAISASLLLLGLGSSRTSFALEQSNQTKALANACSEEALQQIRDSTPFTGTGSLTMGQGTCTYTVTSQGGQNRTITATGTVDTIVRKVKVIIDKINPSINVTSWQEVADF